MPDERDSMEASDNELIMKAQRGDRHAFESLVERYDRQVLSIAYSYTRNAEDAKDIYQEVFLRVHRALPGFEFRSKFSTWLHRVTTNVCLTQKSRSKDHLYDSLDSDPDAEESRSWSETLSSKDRTDELLVNSEISMQIRTAMLRLSPQQKMVFALRHFRGYKIREIADFMDCAQGTVKKYLFTATERLREHLGPIYRPAPPDSE